MSLLDQSKKYYIIDKKSKKSLESGDFLDENGKTIGKLKRDKGEFSILEPSGKLIFKLKKSRMPRRNYEILVENQKFNARYKNDKGSIWWKMSDANALKAVGDFFIYDILENDQILAKAVRIKQSFFKPNFNYDFHRCYLLEIINEPKDRIPLLCFFIGLVEDLKISYDEWFEPFLDDHEYT